MRKVRLSRCILSSRHIKYNTYPHNGIHNMSRLTFFGFFNIQVVMNSKHLFQKHCRSLDIMAKNNINNCKRKKRGRKEKKRKEKKRKEKKTKRKRKKKKKKKERKKKEKKRKEKKRKEKKRKEKKRKNIPTRSARTSASSM